MSRRRLRNPCWKAEYYLKEAQDVISRSYHEFQSLGLPDNSDSHTTLKNDEDTSTQCVNIPHASIQRRKSAVELTSRRLPDSSVDDKMKRYSNNNSNMAVSLFAINVFEENPYPRRKRFTHRQKRNAISHRSRDRLSKSARILNRFYTSSTSTSDENEALSDRKRIFYKKTHESRRQSDSDESSSSVSDDVSENSYPSNLHDSPKIRSGSVSQRAYTSKGPIARRAHRRATARLNSAYEKLQRNQSISHDRSYKTADISMRRAFSVKDLNGEVFDFSKQHSITRWTSQILAEIDSLGCSNVNLNYSTTVRSAQAQVEHNANGSLINPNSHTGTQAVSPTLTNACLEQCDTDITREAAGTLSNTHLSVDTKRCSISAQNSLSVISGQTGSTSSLEESEQDLVEILKHRSSSSKGVECTSHFEIVAEPSSRNVQKTAAVVSRTPVKIPENSSQTLTSLLSRHGHFLCGRGSKQERAPTMCSFSETKASNNFVLNAKSKEEEHIEKTVEVEQATPILQPVMRPSLSADERCISNEALHSSRPHRATNSNKSKTPMRNERSTSFTQWQSLDSCLLVGNERSQENEPTYALRKWMKKAERRGTDEVRYTLEGTSQNTHTRRSVRGIVASLIRTAEATQSQTFFDRSSTILKNTDPTSTTSLKSAATQTSSPCLSRSSSFDWMDEPSDLIDFESLGCHPEPLGNPFQAESECSAAASNDTSSEHSTERRGLAVKCTDVGALSRTLEERIKRLEKAEIQQMLRNNESAQRQMIQDKKTRANEDLDRSVAMLLEYAGELKSSSCDLHVGHRFLSDTRLNAIQQLIRKDGAEVTSLEQHASTSTLNHDSFLVRPLSNEEEANECCQWLRDAGFPQYAKLYQDGCFPIDIDSVKRDHEFLDADSLYALFRRLGALNRCATMREDRVILRQHSESCNEKLIDSSARVDLTTNNYDEEEDQVAISSRWKYHRKSRTWSRIVDVADELKLEADVCRTHERLIPQKRNDVTAFPLELIPTAACNPVGRSAAQHINTSSASREAKSPSSGMPVQRSHSERIKERAKAFIKRMDIRLSSRRRRTREATSRERKGTEEPVIGEPVLISHFSASPRAMHMLPDGIATDLSPRCTPRLVVNARTRMHSSSPTNADVGVGSLV
uniref:StAR-related lipid transfer protein 13 n=1 Tax=Parascaris univalens TaxID=6257 RepID=A0A915BMZ3_PARUN